MAHSPAVLRAYILADAALVRGQLTRRQRKQVALAVAEINGSADGLSVRSATGKSPGLTHPDPQLADNAAAADLTADTILHLTQAVVLQRGKISDDDFQALRKAGFSDAQIVEIVANIALNIFSGYFKAVAETKVDVPVLEPAAASPRIGFVQSQIASRHPASQSPKTPVRTEPVRLPLQGLAGRPDRPKHTHEQGMN